MTSTDRFIARTGRVQSWIDNPKSRLPVSCTVFVVEDSMEGPDGIEASWRFVSHALRYGAGVAVHLSKLRPKGHTNPDGLVASGPVSFAKIYSTLNETLRRGGIYKNGAVVLHLDIDHPDILEFVTAKREELPWVKRCVDLTHQRWLKSTPSVKKAIIDGIRSGDIWLNKIKYDYKGERIYGNVCLEVYLPHRGTCLLEHVNLGQCNIYNLDVAFKVAMRDLCELHAKTGVGRSGEYLSPEVDRQVGLGFIGLANFMRRMQFTYGELADVIIYRAYGVDLNKTAVSFYHEFIRAVEEAAEVARQYKMDRAFAIAPTASCSYRYKDLDGFTTCPEIAPPISRYVDRDSGTFGVESFDYGDVEIASDVSWDDYITVTDWICEVLEETGLFHGYSFNTWSDLVTYNEGFIKQWLYSNHTSMYYALQVMPDTQDKSDVLAALGDEWDLPDPDGPWFAPVGVEDEKPKGYKTVPHKIECLGCSE